MESTPGLSPAAARILDAAEARFAATGYRATSLADIADDVGIRTPSLYKHFAGKQALYTAVLERLLDPYFALLGELLHPPQDEGQALANLTTVVERYVRQPNLARLVQHAALAGGGDVDILMERWFAPLFVRAAELTRDVPLVRGGDPRDAAHLVVAFHTMISGYITLAAVHAPLLGDDPLAPDALARHLSVLRRLAATLWKE